MNSTGKQVSKKGFSYLVWFTFVVILISLVNCHVSERQDRPYLVLYAFEEEGWFLGDKMDIARRDKVLGRQVFSGGLSGKEIVLAESGMGMTNAAMMTQMLIDLYHPKAVIFTGIAGAVDTSVHIGDIVVCQSWITHDYVYHGANGPEPNLVSVYSPLIDSMARFQDFPVESLMFKKAGALVGEEFPFKGVDNRKPRLQIGGIGVSGNAFIDNREKRIWLKDIFDAKITDMETAAVAQVCFVNGLPFIAFRSASDLAGGSGSESAKIELDQFFEVAAENSATVVMKFLESL